MPKWLDLSRYDIERHVREAGTELFGAVVFAIIGGLANKVDGVEGLGYLFWAGAVAFGLKGIYDFGQSAGISEVREKYGKDSGKN